MRYTLKRGTTRRVLHSKSNRMCCTIVFRSPDFWSAPKINHVHRLQHRQAAQARASPFSKILINSCFQVTCKNRWGCGIKCIDRILYYGGIRGTWTWRRRTLIELGWAMPKWSTNRMPVGQINLPSKIHISHELLKFFNFNRQSQSCRRSIQWTRSRKMEASFANRNGNNSQASCHEDKNLRFDGHLHRIFNLESTRTTTVPLSSINAVLLRMMPLYHWRDLSRAIIPIVFIAVLQNHCQSCYSLLLPVSDLVLIKWYGTTITANGRSARCRHLGVRMIWRRNNRSALSKSC